MLSQKRGDLFYLLGLVFLITAIVYFFASNWPGFERPVKLSLSLLIFLSCASAAFFYQRSTFFSYLSNWWLFLSVIAFAVSVALVGQMYNSHADSYILFLVTLIPSVLLSFFTQYRPLYWLSFLLFELFFWLKLYPTGSFSTYSSGEQLTIYLGSVVLHTAMYVFWKKMNEQKLSFFALIAIQICLVYLLVSHPLYDVFAADMAFRFVFFLLHFIYTAFILFFWKAFINKRQQHPFELVIHFVFYGLYAVWNVFYLSFQVVGEYIFYAGFPMLILLFSFSIAALRKIKRLADGSGQKWSQYAVSFFTGALAFIGTVVALFSLSSFAAFFFGFSDNLSFSFLFLAIICIGASFWARKNSWMVVRITLQVTGLVFAFLFAVTEWEKVWPAFFLAISFSALTLLLFKRKESVFFYLAANTAFLFGVFHVFSETDVPWAISTWISFITAAANAIVFLYLKKHHIGLAAFWLSIGFLFYSLTEKGWDSLLLHVLFLLYLFYHLLKPLLETKLYRWPVWGALGGFIIWKYYEYAWLLLHKSLTFLFISALFFSIWFIWGRKQTIPVSAAKWRTVSILVMIVLQSSFILLAAWQKEQLLQNGEVAALELVPVDPRSLLQGDYVQLGYQIQRDYSSQYYSNMASTPDGKIEVVLQQTAESVSYNGKQIPVYKASKFTRFGAEDGVLIKGKGRDGVLSLGIESFFIPENTGTKWEEKTHAIVRIAKNGDAILENLR